MEKNSRITNIDKKIIRLLQADARTSVTDIAKEVGLSRNAVKYRIQMLEREGYIKKYQTIINPKKFGKKITIIFNLDVDLCDLKKTIKELKNFNSLSNISIATGNPSIVAVGLFENHDELNNFIMKRLVNLPIKNYNITTILEEVRESNFNI